MSVAEVVLAPPAGERILRLGQRVEVLAGTCEALERDRQEADRQLRALEAERRRAVEQVERLETERRRAIEERNAARRERDRMTKEAAMAAQEAVQVAAHAAATQVPGNRDGASGAKRQLPRLALSKTEAAEALGVSVDFLDAHIAHELRCVRRGRRRLYAVAELERWLAEQAERAWAA